MKTKQNEDKDNVFSVVEHWSFLLQIFLISSQISGSMASLHLGAASLINESWVVFGSSLRLRIGFRSKRFRRVAERWMFCVQQMSVKDQMTKQELARSAKRSESLRYILKQYGVSVENPEENSRLDDLNCEAKHDAVPSSVIDDSKMKTIEELPDLRQEEKYSETASTVDNLSGHQHHKFPHLNTGGLFTSLLPALVFCIVCIIGTLHTIISRKTSRGHHHGSKRTRWRTALSDWDEPLASDEHDSSPEYRVGSANQEATDEVNEAYSRVELEYKRFLLECGVSES